MKFHSDWIERNVFYTREHNAEENCPHFMQYERPVIVCLCGSTRFAEAFVKANKDETLAGRIVLSVGMFGHVEGLDMNGQVKAGLDVLHKEKINLADEVLVLNVGGYVGASTCSEVRHAINRGKNIRWLEPNLIPAEFAPPAEGK